MANATARDLITSSLQAAIAAKQALLNDVQMLERIQAAGQCMVDALQHGRTLLLFGNGGSAADAQHIVAEFTGRFMSNDRPPLPAISLTANTSALTAIANDFSYDEVFARQLEALGHAGDVAIGISTSGRSPSVLKAMAVAARLQIHTIGLTGGSGGALAHEAGIAIVVPSDNTQRIQECHIAIGHVWCELVERAYLARRTQ